MRARAAALALTVPVILSFQPHHQYHRSSRHISYNYPQRVAAAALSASSGGAETASDFSYADADADADADSAPPRRILCKTAETFRLADLYLLEATLRSTLRGVACNRLCVDGATGSTLLAMGATPTTGSGTPPPLPSVDPLGVLGGLSGVEWAAEELAYSDTAGGLVEDLLRRSSDVERAVRRNRDNGDTVEWSIDYVRMGGAQGPRRNRPDYTARSLMCRVAQALTLPAALDPKRAGISLVLLDTSDALRLCVKVQAGREVGEDGNGRLTDLWTSRPFQYSSAIHPLVGRIVVDVLLDMVRAGRGKAGEGPIWLLDPTCGSGTLLAHAVSGGASAVGWDINACCADGSRANLVHLFGDAVVGDGEDDDGRVVIERRDASLGVGRPDDAEVHAVVDCVAGNLPWNRNTPAFEGDNSNILRTVRALLQPGAPCAIVSGGKDVQKDMPRLGYKILATASIPQSNFKLPKSKKAKKGSEGSGGRSMCVVTIAVAK